METFLADLLQALSARGVSCEALVHASEPGLHSRRETPGPGESPVVYRAATWGRLFFTPLSPVFPFLLSRRIRRTRPAVLHLHLPNISAFWVLLLPGARKLPWILHWHSDVPHSDHALALRLFRGLYGKFERMLLRRAAVVIATSPAYLDSSPELQPYRHKCRVIPLGLDPQRLLGCGSAPALATDARPLRVLCIGRFSYYKGFQYALRAAAEFAGMELHFIGSGDTAAELQRLAADLGIAGRVHFHGDLDEAGVARQLAECDCLCLPSIERSEAFGLVLLEAMSFARATVISDVAGSGMGWVVEQGVTGLKVEPMNAAALAQAFAALAADRDYLARLGLAGRQRFDSEFAISRCADRIVEVYRDLA